MVKSKLSTNIVYNLAYQILVLILPIITAPYVSSTLDVDGIGTFSYISSVAYYFYIVITLGLNNYGNRAIAKCGIDKKKRSEKFWSIYSMQISIGIIVISSFIGYTIFFVGEELKRFFLIYAIYVAAAAFDVNWFFFGIQQFKTTTIRSSIIKLLSLILTFTFVKGENALAFYMMIIAGSMLLSNLVLWTQLRRYIVFYKPSPKEVLIHLKPNIILFVPILALSIYRVMDKIMIKELSGIIQNGYYENADRIITMSLTVFSAVGTVMMPTISSMVVEDNSGAVKRFLRDMMQITSFLSVAMTFGLAAIARVFAPLFFGSQYLETGILLTGLSVTIFLSGWKNVLRSQYLIPYEKDTPYVISLVAGAIVNVLMNAFLIPRFGARGAVIGTIFAEATGFVIQTYEVNKNYKTSQLAKDAAVFLPAGLIMGLCVHFIVTWLPSSLISIAASIIIGALIYFGLAVLSLRVVSPQRLGYFKRLIFERLKR